MSTPEQTVIDCLSSLFRQREFLVTRLNNLEIAKDHASGQFTRVEIDFSPMYNTWPMLGHKYHPQCDKSDLTSALLSIIEKDKAIIEKRLEEIDKEIPTYFKEIT